MHKVRRAKRKKKSTLVDKKYAYMQRNMQGDENMLVYVICFIIVLQTEPYNKNQECKANKFKYKDPKSVNF